MPKKRAKLSGRICLSDTGKFRERKWNHENPLFVHGRNFPPLSDNFLFKPAGRHGRGSPRKGPRGSAPGAGSQSQTQSQYYYCFSIICLFIKLYRLQSPDSPHSIRICACVFKMGRVFYALFTLETPGQIHARRVKRSYAREGSRTSTTPPKPSAPA